MNKKLVFAFRVNNPAEVLEKACAALGIPSMEYIEDCEHSPETIKKAFEKANKEVNGPDAVMEDTTFDRETQEKIAQEEGYFDLPYGSGEIH